MPTKIVFRAMLCAMALCGSAIGAAESLDALKSYDYGRSRAPLLAVEAAIREANGSADALAGIERQLVAIIEGDCTRACRQFCCEQLALIGTARAVPALAALLQNTETAPMALYALEEIPGPEATQALLEALQGRSGASHVAVINALGTRGDSVIIPALIPLLDDADAKAALAAAHALGLSGASAAIAAVEAALAGASIHRHPALAEGFARACLLGADRMMASGQSEQARSIFERFFWSDYDKSLREAALNGLIRSTGPSGLAVVFELLWGNLPGMEHVAIPFVRDMPGGGEVARFLPNMRPEVQAMVIDALAERGDPSVLPHIIACFDRPGFSGEAVLLAAVRAVGRLGDGDALDTLLQAGVTDPVLREAVVAALSRLRGSEINGLLQRALSTSNDETRAVMVIRALTDRRAITATPVLLEHARLTGGAGQEAALKALAVLAGPGEVSPLLTLALALKGGARRLAGDAVVAAAHGKAGPVLASLRNAPSSQDRPFLVGLLPRIGDDDAVETLRALVEDAPEALDALAHWPSGAAVTVLADAFTGLRGDRRKTALEGAMRGFTKPHAPTGNTALSVFKALLAAASAKAEYTEIFAALARVGDARALDLIRPYLAGHGIDPEARAALDATRRGLYRATASHKSGAAANAIDGILETRWDTGAPQLGKEWFVLDLGLPYTVRGVTLDTSPSPEGYPGEVAIYLGNDGRNWGEAVGKQKGAAKMIFTFAPTPARYVKAAQVGKRETQLWSIHEITVDAVPGK